MNLGTVFSRHARYRPDHTAVVFGDRRLTHLELNRNINRLANVMTGLGIQKGAKVATVLPNCLELFETYWAAAKIGAVVVPMSTLLMEGALRSLLKDADAQMVITNKAFANVLETIRPDLPKLREGSCLLVDAAGIAGFHDYHALTDAADENEPTGIRVDGDDPFNIMYSSGTTGLPKGILHTHAIRITKQGKRLPDKLDSFILGLGRWLSWANGLLVLVIVLQVILRYGFGHGLVLLEELEWHLFALAFMFGLSYALTTDAHVRVDLLHGRFPAKAKHWIEVLGTLFLLFPFIFAVMYHSYDFFIDSWIHNESSAAPLGMPFRWAIKAVIPLSFGMFGLAALSRMIRSLTAIFTSANGTH